MIQIPTINPIRFSRSGINDLRADKRFYRDYFQKYQLNDTTHVQFIAPNDHSDYDLSAYDSSEIVQPYSFKKTTSTDLITGYTVIEFAIHFSQFKEDRHRFKLSDGTDTWWSDWICVKEEHPYTRMLTYRNTYNEQNVAFSSNIVFSLRVETFIGDPVLASEESIYSSETGAYSMLSSYPYANFNLNIGGTTGIPDWMASIVNQIFSCDIVYLNEQRINKVEGASFEAVTSENYNLKSWNIEVGKTNDALIQEDNSITINSSDSYELVFESTDDPKTVEVFSTLPWTATPPDGISPSSGVDAETLTEVTVTPAPNPTFEDIVETVNFVQAGGFKSVTLTKRIKGAVPFITLDGKTELSISAGANDTTVQFVLNTNDNWQVVAESVPAWITGITPDSGASSTQTVNIAFTANPDETARTADIHFVTEHGTEATVSLVQHENIPPEDEISVDASDITSGYDDGSQGVGVTSTTDWEVLSTDYWLSVTPSTGVTGTTLVEVAWEENFSNEPRNGTVVFQQTGTSGKTVTISVMQLGKPAWSLVYQNNTSYLFEVDIMLSNNSSDILNQSNTVLLIPAGVEIFNIVLRSMNNNPVSVHVMLSTSGLIDEDVSLVNEADAAILDIKGVLVDMNDVLLIT